jgi:fructokinase
MCQRGRVTSDPSALTADAPARNGAEGGQFVLVVGEVLVDMLPTGAAPGGAMKLEGRFGGSPANVAVGLARLECRVGFAGRLARGGYGPWLRAHLESEGIDLRPSVPADEPCTLAVVTLDAGGSATYEFYGPDTADWRWQPAELPEPSLLAGGCVHTGSLATALAPGAGVLLDWLGHLRRRADVAVSYDPNVRPSLFSDVDALRELVRRGRAAAHLVKVSADDLAALEPGVGVDDVVSDWMSGAGPELIVVTGGGDGAVAWHRDGRRVHRPAPPVTVVDTVGAGDAFSAGLLASLSAAGVLSPSGLASIDNDVLTRAVDRGILVASLTCARAGADPPRLAELPATSVPQ